MTYSSGLFTGTAETLEDAQDAKLSLIEEFLDLDGSEEVLEIGSGWGTLARRIAASSRARVTGLTLSREQLAHSRALAAAERLDRQCQFRLEDYRDVSGTFDRVVAIEMIEAVGEEYWPRFFATLAERLKWGGTTVLQAITISEDRFEVYRRKADFIQRQIFPGGMLPTPARIEEHAAAAGLTLDRVEHFGRSYARTISEWRERFEAAWPQISSLGFDERFQRRWRYYFAYCEAGFLDGVIDVGLYRLRKA
jgi:cyclopropane-fatty-acyl-phospholipid synthase